jgi:hypothetical protein
MMKRIALSALLFVISCSGTATPSPSPSDAAIPAMSPAASPNALPGSTFSMPADRDMAAFYADRGALVAYVTKDVPPPYDSKIVRALAPNGPWTVVYETDAIFMIDRVSSGRIGLAEYRERYQGGGAYSEVFVVVDLANAQRTEIDRFALSAAAYRGGGGAPRRPAGAMALGPDRVAWTRLVEGAGGSVNGELRIASLGDPHASHLVATSSEWVRPIGLDAHRLVYLLATKTEETLHVRDVDSGADAVVATGAAGDTARGQIPAFDNAAVSGDWAIWLDGLKAATTKAHALNLVTGEERLLDVPGSQCSGVTAGSRYFVWSCGKPSDASPQGSPIIDAQTLDTVRPIPTGVGLGLLASDDGLLWFKVDGGARTVTLFRPR